MFKMMDGVRAGELAGRFDEASVSAVCPGKLLIELVQEAGDGYWQVGGTAAPREEVLAGLKRSASYSISSVES